MRRLLIMLFALILMLIATSLDRRIRDYAVIYVDEKDVIDADAMLKPPEKYLPLLQIDADTRKLVAEHMKMNNYKLKSGKQEFIKNNPTFKELVAENFKFEKIA